MGNLIDMNGQPLEAEKEEEKNPLEQLGPRAINALMASFLQGIAAALQIDRDPVTFVTGDDNGSFAVTVTYVKGADPKSASVELGFEEEKFNA